MARVRVKNALQVVRNVTSGPLYRFFRLDYPDYRLPVVVKERVSEPYEALEWFVMRFLIESGISSIRHLSTALGLTAYRKMLQETIVHLSFIGHVQTAGKELTVTELGRTSYANKMKVYEVDSKRLVYFDALGLRPLHREMYESHVIEYLALEDRTALYNAQVMDIWSELSARQIASLTLLRGEERMQVNLPQEMTAISMDAEYLSATRDDGGMTSWPILYFAPLYVAWLESPVNAGSQLDGKHLEVYSGTSGKRLPWLEKLLISHLNRLDFVQRLQVAGDDHLEILGLPLGELVDTRHMQVLASGNYHYVVRETDVAAWSKSAAVGRILRHVHETTILPLEDRQVTGRVLSLSAATPRVLDQLVALLCRLREEQLDKQAYSAEYVADEIRLVEDAARFHWACQND